MTDKSYGSGTDATYNISIIVSIAVPLLSALIVATQFGWLLAAPLIIIAIVLPSILVANARGTAYILTENVVLIKSFGSKDEVIRYSDITSVAESRDIRKAKATSLDRVVIIHKGGETYISPADKHEFIADLDKKIKKINVGSTS